MILKGFISIEFVVDKLTIFKFLHTDSSSMKWPFLEKSLASYSPKYG